MCSVLHPKSEQMVYSSLVHYMGTGEAARPHHTRVWTLVAMRRVTVANA